MSGQAHSPEEREVVSRGFFWVLYALALWGMFCLGAVAGVLTNANPYIVATFFAGVFGLFTTAHVGRREHRA